MRNYYKALGVAAVASERHIKGAFHSLAETFHPDVNAGDALAEWRSMSAPREESAPTQFDYLVRPSETGDLP
jgi:curved DNA-binding protein CbpA